MLRILHVDDSADDYELTKINLERRAPTIQIVWTDSAESALERLEKESFDCILCDYQMPGHNGLEFLKRIRSQGYNTPFIFFTGQGSEEIAAEALRIGADDYFTKEIGFAFYDRIANSIRKVVESHRRLAEQQRSEERYALLFDSLTVGVAVYEAVDGGKEFIFKDLNRAGEQIEQVRRKDIIGRKVTEVFPGVKEFGLHDIFKRVYIGGIPERHPVSFYRDKRHQGWRKNYVYKLPTGEIVAIYEDITLFKEALERLQVDEEQLTLALEATHDGIWDWNIASGEVIFSPRYMKMLGYEPNELPNKIETFENLLHPEDRKESLLRLSELFASGEENAKIELRMKTKDGGWKKVLCRGRIVERDEDGKPLRMVGTQTDIDDMMLDEEETLRGREYLSLIMDMTDHAVIATDTSGQVVLINRVGEKLTGLRTSVAVGKAVTEVVRLLCQTSGESVTDPLTAILAGCERSMLRFECLLEGSGGKKTAVVGSVAPVKDTSGRLSGTVIVLRPAAKGAVKRVN